MMDDSHIDDSLVFNSKGELVPKGTPTDFGKVRLCGHHGRAYVHTGQDGSRCDLCALAERVKELGEYQQGELDRLTKTFEVEATNTKLRAALKHIRDWDLSNRNTGYCAEMAVAWQDIARQALEEK